MARPNYRWWTEQPPPSRYGHEADEDDDAAAATGRGTSIEPHFVNSYPAYSFNLEESLILQLLVLAFCHYFSAHFDFPAIINKNNSQLQFAVLFISWLHYNWRGLSFADVVKLCWRQREFNEEVSINILPLRYHINIIGGDDSFSINLSNKLPFDV